MEIVDNNEDFNVQKEQWNEKLGVIINYFLIARAMVDMEEPNCMIIAC